MDKYIALLRGINVSGQKLIKMVELKDALKKESFSSVETYIQSGNIVFQSSESSTSSLAVSIKNIIKNSFGYDVPVLVLKQDVFHETISMNPFMNEEVDTKSLYVGFMYDIPETTLIARLKDLPSGKDEYEF